MTRFIAVAVLAISVSAPADASPVSIAHFRKPHAGYLSLKMRRHSPNRETLRAYPSLHVPHPESAPKP
jgi:hypothetical protein